MWCENSHSVKETQTRLFSPQGSSWCLYIKTPGSFGVSWWLILCFSQRFNLFLNIPKQFLAPEPISGGSRKPKQTPGPQWGANQDILTDKPANDFCATFLTSQCGFYLSAKCYCYLRVADMTAAHACVHLMKICTWQSSIRLHGLRTRCLQINLQKRWHTSETDGLILVVSRNKECCQCLYILRARTKSDGKTNNGDGPLHFFCLSASFWPFRVFARTLTPTCWRHSLRPKWTFKVWQQHGGSRLSADRYFFIAESFFLLNDARFPQIKKTISSFHVLGLLYFMTQKSFTVNHQQHHD